jgi:hypothetical protein
MHGLQQLQYGNLLSAFFPLRDRGDVADQDEWITGSRYNNASKKTTVEQHVSGYFAARLMTPAAGVFPLYWHWQTRGTRSTSV